MAHALNLEPSRIVWMDQVHGGTVRIVRRIGVGGVLDACDACLTTLSDVALCVRSADCLPVVLRDRQGECVSAIHAGWRGLLAGIVLNGLNTLCREICRPPEDILVSMGPSIEQRCYSVGEDVQEKFKTVYGRGARRFFRRDGQSLYFSLMGMATWQLETAGVPTPQIQPGMDCTACSAQEFFSFRSRREDGRIATFIFKDSRDSRAEVVRRILK